MEATITLNYVEYKRLLDIEKELKTPCLKVLTQNSYSNPYSPVTFYIELSGDWESEVFKKVKQLIDKNKEVIKIIEKEKKQVQERSFKLQETISNLSQLSFYKRLVFLFKGKIDLP